MRTPLFVLPLLLACRGADSTPTDDSGLTERVCREGPAPASAAKTVVVSHPYSASGSQASAWELLTLEGDELSSTGVSFEMGRGQGGPIVWAPDGSLAVAVQDDGTLGFFTPDGTVIEAGWSEGLYAVDVAFDAVGQRLFMVDGNWVENGGGVYEVAVDCETGAPSLVGLITESKLGSWLLGDVLVADSAAWTINLDTGALGAPTALFDYPEPIVGGADRRGDTLYVGDYSLYSGTDNRVAIARVQDGVVNKTGEVVLEDPYAIVAVEGGAVVCSGYGDSIVGITAAGVQDTLRSELPGAAALGPEGRVLVAEVSGVRTVRFDGSTLEDLAFYPTDGMERMVGSIGIAP